MALRVMAVSAPEKIRMAHSRHVLKSDDPASLCNAYRYAGSLAADGVGSWGESNWAEQRANRWNSILLMNHVRSAALPAIQSEP